MTAKSMMPDWSEAHVIINGTELSLAQAMTLRVGLTMFLMNMQEEYALGSDETGEGIRKGYLRAAREIITLLSER